MDIFVVAISRADVEPQAQARSTMRVEVTAGRARVTELNVRADESGSVDTASLPVIDLLLRAFAGEDSPIQPEREAPPGNEAPPRPEAPPERARRPKPR